MPQGRQKNNYVLKQNLAVNEMLFQSVLGKSEHFRLSKKH